MRKLLEELNNRKIHLWIQDGELKYKAPKNALTDELRMQIRQNKEEIILLLGNLHSAGKMHIPPRADKANPPLSYAQERLWFLNNFEVGESMAYHMPAVLKFSGKLNTKALGMALETVVQRHEALRTRFIERDEETVQVIDGSEVLEVMEIACSEASVAGRIDEELKKTFDLRGAIPFRATLYQINDQTHYLLVNMHHIVSDGWSLGILVREFTTLYVAYTNNQIDPLPPLRVQYGDYAAWQKDYLSGKVLDEKLNYWIKELSNIEPLAIPTTFPRPATQSNRGHHQRFQINKVSTAHLHALSKQYDATLFMTLLSLFGLLMHKYTGQDEFVVGSPVANRGHSDIEPMIGLFVNTLAIKQDFRDDMKFSTILQQTKERILGAYEHQDVPFEKIVDALDIPRDTSRSPLFQVMFVLQNNANDALELPGLTIEHVEIENPTSKFDITMEITEKNGELEGVIEYATDLFSATYIDAMIGHFSVLIESVVRDETQPTSSYPLLTQAESDQLLIEYNDTQAPYPQEKCIHQLFEEQVERLPENIAVVYEDSELTYAQLNVRANQLAHHLIGQGVGPDDLVAICVDRSLEMMVGLLAILKAGGAYVPIDPTYPRERIEHMLNDSGAKILLTQTRWIGMLPETQSHVIDMETLETDANGKDNPRTPVSSRHLAYVIYTSGSTGKPKGVMIEHRSVVALIFWAKRQFPQTFFDCTLASTSYTFDLSVFEMFVPLSLGGSALVVPNILSIIHRKTKYPITLVNTVPSAVKQLHDAQAIPQSIGAIFLAGEKLKQGVVDALHSLEHVNTVYDLYGPSEDTTYTTYAQRVLGGVETIGRPISNTQLYILDANLNPLPKGIIGELHIAGDGLARGYLNRPTLTSEKFIPNPFSSEGKLYKTGDLARYMDDGNIEYIGRADEQVKIRGFRIELGEIEQQLLSIRAIKECVVLAKENGQEDKVLVTYMTLQQGEEISISAIKGTLSQHLPDYMIPMAYEVLEEMPLTPNGKIDKKTLAALEVVMRSTKSYVAPRNQIEEKLAAIFSEILGVEQVGVYDNFFELGGHSLLAMKLVSKVRSELEIELPLRELFAEQSINGIALGFQKYAKENVNYDIPPRADKANPPLSYAQERLWFLNNFEVGESMAYHMPAVLKFSGKLNTKALGMALETVVQRHEALRTRFIERDEETVQVIDGSEVLEVMEIACSEASVAGRIDEELKKTFDLRGAIPFRATLYQINDQTHYLLVNMHHIVSDGWSLGILVREFTTLYVAYTNNQIDPLPPLRVQYGDYAAWQKDYLSGKVLDEKLNYWIKELSNIEPLAIPTTFPRPATQSNRGHHQRFQINKVSTAHLHALSKQYDATLFMTLLSLFGLLMHKYTGQDEFVVGSPVANRGHSDIEPMIGLFVNTLAIKQDFRDDMKFSTILQQTKERILGAYEHQDVPFEKIVDALDIPRDTSRSPLFQVMFVLQNNANDALELPGLTIEHVEIENPTSKFDITMEITEKNGELEGVIEYATDLFSATYIDAMIGHFSVLIESVVRDETQPTSSYPLLTQAESDQLLIEYNDTQAPYPQEKCIHQLFEEQVERLPENIAVVYEDSELTYAQLNVRANQLAHHLIGQGVGPDDLVAICVDRSLEMMVGLLAILKAGGAYVPIDPTYPRERIEHMLNDSGAKILLTQTRWIGMLPETQSHVIDMETLETDANGKDNPRTPVSSRHLAYVIYTSGSTGKPKGVMIEHRSVVNRIDWMQREYQLHQQTAILQKTPFSFDVSVWELFMPLMYGAKEVLVRPGGHKDAKHIAALLADEKITMIHFVPSMLSAALDQGVFAQATSLEHVVCSGEALSPELVTKYFTDNDTALHNLYGPTEASIDVSYHSLSGQVHFTVPIGRPISNTQLYILDANLNPLPKGIIGELHIAGDGLARGYLNRPTLTSEKFIPNPFSSEGKLYKTGDLARYMDDGNIEYIGRADEQVKIRGFRIELGEIEQQLLSIRAIKECVVLAKENGQEDKVLVTYMTLQQGEEISISAIKGTLSQHLPDYMIPMAYEVLEEMPLTPNGKIDKKTLAALEVVMRSTKSYVAPRNQIEEKLAAIFSEILGVEQVGVYDNFFELGGHSLLAMKLVSKVRSELEIELPLRELFGLATLEELGAIIAKSPKAKQEEKIYSMQEKYEETLHDGSSEIETFTL